YVGEAALACADREAFALVVKFFNTYLRSTLNGQQVRTAYNVLHQYRQLTEHALSKGEFEIVGQVAFYLKYYGQLAHGMHLGFVTETVAYDLGALCERAFTAQAPIHETILKIFLELDKEAESQAQETMLRGVRKAQAKLASFYLVSGAENHARQIYE